MIINGRVVSEYDFFYRRDRDKQVRKHREAGYPGEYRLVLDGLVLEHTRYRSAADWWFFDHIRTATTDPEHFVFNGYGGNGQRAGPWLEHHRARFDLPSWSGELTLVDPKNNLIDRFIFGKAPMLCTEPVGTITTLFGRFPCRVEISPAVSQERGYYTYQPQRYANPEAAITTHCSLIPHTKNADGTWTPPAQKWYPFFATPDEAVAYMVQNKVYGCVQRYAVTDDLGPLKKKSWIGRDEQFEYDNNPYLTAGVVRCVETKDREEKGLAHASPLSVLSGDITGKEVVYV